MAQLILEVLYIFLLVFNNSIILQWGFCSGTTTQTYIFPITFSNTSWHITFSMGNTNGGGNFGAVWLQAYDRTASTFTHYRNSTIDTQDYICIGY